MRGGHVIEYHDCADSLETVAEGNIDKLPILRCTHVNLDGSPCGFTFSSWERILSRIGQWQTTRTAIDAHRKAERR